MAQVNIVIALLCEARPLIEHFRLRKQTEISEFDIFVNQQKSLYLIISGVGKVNAAAATSFLHVWSGRARNAYYINIGIAGSYARSMGELLWVHKIGDQASGYNWYMSALPLRTATTTVLTVDKPCSDYAALYSYLVNEREPQHALIEMEAAGFFAAAIRCVAQEQVQVIKIVSDNAQQPQQQVTAVLVTQLIQQQLPRLLDGIDACLSASQAEANLQAAPRELSEFLQRWHFTIYQQHQLRELLRRWELHLSEQNALAELQQHSEAQQVLNALIKKLDQAVY